jgi:hypothetical protein
MFKQSFVLSMLVLVLGAAAHAADPFTGKWKIDAPKSSWSNGQFPKGMSLEINLEFNGDELKYHSINDTNKDKKPAFVDYTAKLDWKVYPLTGGGRYNQVAARRLSKNEMEIMELKDGDVIVGAVYEILPGGKRFVRRGIAKSPDGSSHEYEEFFDKQ